MTSDIHRTPDRDDNGERMQSGSLLLGILITHAVGTRPAHGCFETAHAEPASEILDELPGHPTGTSAAGHRPFNRSLVQRFDVDWQFHGRSITVHHREVGR